MDASGPLSQAVQLQCMDQQAIQARFVAIEEHLQEHELQQNWCGFHIQRLEALWSDIQQQQSRLAQQVAIIRRSILRLLAIVRQQRTFLRRIDYRVGQLEERVQVAFVHSADQADTLADLERAIGSLRAVLARPLLELVLWQASMASKANLLHSMDPSLHAHGCPMRLLSLGRPKILKPKTGSYGNLAYFAQVQLCATLVPT